jgi:hypothetical protein
MALLENARDAGADNIYVASSLRRRRYRVLTVIDDGHGVRANYADRITDPGVTSRHLTSSSAGLSLHHIKQISEELRLASNANPTAITATFDTTKIPEKTLQSSTRPSNSNMRSRMREFRSKTPQLATLICGAPSQVLANLLDSHIIQTKCRVGSGSGVSDVCDFSTKVGLELSERTVRRVLMREVRGAVDIGATDDRKPSVKRYDGGGVGALSDAPVMRLTDDEVGEIAGILGRAAAARYLTVGNVRAEARAGELRLRVRVDDPEEEYE